MTPPTVPRLFGTLVIDVGNTSTHAAFRHSDGSWTDLAAEPTARLSSGPALAAALGHWTLACRGRPHRIAWASVVPSVGKLLPIAATMVGWVDAADRFELTAESVVGLGVDVAEPGRVGADRLANAFAARARGGLPAVAVDLGTATTLDVVTGRGYSGGAIAPGPALVLDYLHERTALLPRLDPAAVLAAGAPRGWARDTETAMRLGATVGYAGMVLALVRRVAGAVARAEGRKPRLLLTGGAVGLLPAAFRRRHEVVPRLTLEGIALAADAALSR